MAKYGWDRPRARLIALLTAVLVLAVGLPSVVSAQATPEAAPVATPAGVVEIPNTPVGAQLAWLLDQMNGDPSALTDAELGDRFNDAFLDEVSPDEIRELLGQLAAAGPWSIVSLVGTPGEHQLQAVVRGPQTALLVSLSVEAEPPHKVNGLFFQPPPAASWDEVDAGLATLGPEVSFLAAAVSAAGCEPLHAVAATEPMAIGSAFKLYVLGELARQVESGEASWDEVLPLREEWKSLPTGDLRHEPAGTPHTLRYYAEVMISQSDNTATDHLVYRLGRENVEAMLATMGHVDPSHNVPLLTTRELFVIKLSLSEEEREAYLAAGPDERRAMLDGPIAERPLPTLEEQATYTEPLLIDEIEWFASAEDLCRAMTYLHGRADEPGLLPVREILTLNPGVPLDRAIWPTVLFKGGSEPGVLNLTLLLVRNDGQAFVVAVSVANPDGAVDTNATLAVVMGAAGLIAAAP